MEKKTPSSFWIWFWIILGMICFVTLLIQASTSP